MLHLPFLARLLARWTPRPTLTRGASPLLFGALVLAGCGGGGSDEPTIGMPVEATRDATIQPVKVRPLENVSAPRSALDELQGDPRVGMEASHDQ